MKKRNKDNKEGDRERKKTEIKRERKNKL